MKKVALTCLTASLLFGSGMALADAAASVEYRQSVFKVVKWHMDSLGAMARGDVEFNADAAVHHARQVNAMSYMAQEGFGEGTLGGDAKPEIWSNWDQFAGGMERFQEVSGALVVAAEEGSLQALRPAVGQMGQTCRTCHDNFRN
ncbi:MAG: c-type cytochrome [Nitrincola lacisaponensis]|uniref:Putative c'cytochrome n=1 Tax=Nitrincola lacisaponensis TaxID=267850 RepID=A0A063Y601_9GAMM|nr:cytochrome c [Nitrincola lacisaponensis]KDE40555.1 putative c'cytochrome [Nitrincola lacisaponensis]